MGVPKFFRFISERYPCLSELVREEKIPEFDNLYLDMNGIIHNCTHPDDANVHFRLSEEEMQRDIFMYIDKLFFLIKPQKLFFMAVDGVAPRAKMNQQRSRRFRSAKEAEVLQSTAVMKGEVLPDTRRFDSNCITPGTEFMVRLQNSLKKYIQFKMNSCPRWQGVRVILSGHETPGEGEHKIMEYIRFLKANPEYEYNTRHCLYGLDADLIVLGLCTHELHFSLLREEVRFGRKAKRSTLEETRFYLFHLTLLRDYLELEFQTLKSFERFDIDKLIDDWILMGFLVGNDFIPHLPFLHINSDALPTLYEAYIKCWPTLDGYINENGDLNLQRLQLFMSTLAHYEESAIGHAIADIHYLEGKRSAKDADIFEAFDLTDPIDENNSNDDDLKNLIKETELDFDVDDISETTVFKRNYYITKLKYKEVNPEILQEQTKCYITALQWILYYYYKGVPSWGWFYPHHYAPFASDMTNIADLNIKFDIGKPFLPFQQLLAVLPSASKDLLPEAFWDLMTNPNSSLINYYPHEFETDLNGKRQDWEAVVLIPFIDEHDLLKAMEPCIKQLSAEELARNIHGPMLQYDYMKTTKVVSMSKNSFNANGYCNEKTVWREDLKSPRATYSTDIRQLRKLVHKGFPTFKFLNYKAELRLAKVKVFEQPSRKENMIIMPEINSDTESLLTIAKKCLNKIVFIGWPHIIEAKVISISTRDEKVNKSGQLEKNNSKEFDLYAKRIYDHNITRMGIDFQEISTLVHVLPLAGWEQVYNLNGNVTNTKVWSTVEIQYPFQAIVLNAYEKNRTNLEESRIENVFSVGSSIFMLGQPYYGCEGKVLDALLVYSCGRMKVSITVLPEPDLSEARAIQSTLEAQYFNQYDTATKLGITAPSVTRITGSVLVIKGERRTNLPENTPKVNIGLQLRYHKTNEELVGYTRKIGNTWLYSNKAIELIKSYYTAFPKLIEIISKTSPREDIFEPELCSDMDEEGLNLNNITTWLKDQEHKQAERVACGTKTIQKEALAAIISSLEKLKALPVRNIKLQVKPHLVLKPGQKIPETCRLKKPLRLFDRVVVIKDTYQVPFGCRGTIVAIHPVTDHNPVRIECMNAVEMFYEVLLDKEHPEGNKLHGLGAGRIFKVSEQAIIPTYETDARINKAKEKTKELNKGNNVTAENDQQILCKKLENLAREVGDKASDSNEENHKIFLPEPLKHRIQGNLHEGQKVENNKINKNLRNSYPRPSSDEPPVINNQVSKKNDFIQPPLDQWFRPPQLNEIPVKSDNWRCYTKNQHGYNNHGITKIIPFKGEVNVCHKINTDETEALKELLGLSGRAQTNEKTSNLKNVFPQPPTNWRIDSFAAPIYRTHNYHSIRGQNAQNVRPIKILEKNSVHKPLVDMTTKFYDVSSELNVQCEKTNAMEHTKKQNLLKDNIRDPAKKKRKTPRIAAKFDNI